MALASRTLDPVTETAKREADDNVSDVSAGACVVCDSAGMCDVFVCSRALLEQPCSHHLYEFMGSASNSNALPHTEHHTMKSLFVTSHV